MGALTPTPQRRERRALHMEKRLPRPAKPTRPRCEVDESELKLIEDAAHLCRLSVASFIRVALVETVECTERIEEWKKIAERLMRGTGDTPPKRPGRPKRKKP